MTEDDRLVLQNAAEAGDAKAQCFFGILYFTGEDYAEAAKWFRKAAEQGDANAQYHLGLLYIDGKGVPEDYARAAEWFREAAEQGDANAQYLLGLAYGLGNGVPKDYTKAAEWLRKAAAQGNEEAEDALVKLEAIIEEEKAQKAREAKEAAERAAKEKKAREEKEAAERLRNAAAQGDAGAQYELGRLYVKGQGVPQDYAMAAKWFGNAATQGDAGAQYELGCLYFTGQGVTQNYAKAAEWFGKAAAQGHGEAMGFLVKAEAEIAERAAKEKRRKIGRVIAPLLAVLSIIVLFAGAAGATFISGDESVTLVAALLIAIPFLVLYFSSRKKETLRWIFFGGNFISVPFMFVGFFQGYFFLVAAMGIGMASCITAKIFPKD